MLDPQQLAAHPAATAAHEERWLEELRSRLGDALTAAGARAPVGDLSARALRAAALPDKRALRSVPIFAIPTTIYGRESARR